MKQKKSKKKPARVAKKAPSKRVKPKRAPSKQTDLSRAEVSIMARMAELDEKSPRYRVLESALAFKASWIVLGEHLSEVLRKGWWREWGYVSFERYCDDEIHVTTGTAKKLVRSFQWLGAEAPEYLESVSRAREGKRPQQSAPVALPDLKAVEVMAEAKTHLDEHRVPEDAYLALKQAALDGEAASVLRRTLKDAIPAHLKPKSANDKVRHLRRALTSCVKVIDALREWDAMPGEAANEDVDGDALIVEAEKLRDAIAIRLPRGDASSTEKDAAE